VSTPRVGASSESSESSESSVPDQAGPPDAGQIPDLDSPSVLGRLTVDLGHVV
jgi:hypothetical protein